MGIRVKEDLVRGSRAGNSLVEVELVRVFQVSGLKDLPKEIIITTALEGVDSVNSAIRIPNMNQSYPDPNFTGCVVADRRTESLDNPDVVNVYVTYRWKRYPSLYLKSVSGSLRQIDWVLQEYKDGGKPKTVTISYQPPSVTVPNPNPKKDGPLIYKRLIYEGNVSFKFIENIDPEYFNTRYAGVVNQTMWRGYPPRTILLLPVHGSTEDNFWFNNTYTIVYRPETHDEYVFFVDDFGRVPPDVAKSVVLDGSSYEGNGWKRGRALPEIDFNWLFGSRLTAAAPPAYDLNYISTGGSG